MLYYLFTPHSDVWIGFNVFRYISFRSASAAVLALVISLFIGPLIIKWLQKKQIGEEILKDASKAHDLNIIALRYFNPIGAHPTIKIGELPLGVPQNLIPYITQTAAGMRAELSVFGDDYDTEDGTAVRDYIHVVDLALGHVKALAVLDKIDGCEPINLGTGNGVSVLDIVHTFEKISGQNIPYQIAPRRAGDIATVFANAEKAESADGFRVSLL